ncbi:DUF2285 domain-containing protein [Sphingomonas sp. So64.6b]|uniref:DUF2285 domain-containing protein n=1 Tax=Sphingomonas sp. So64.6b TaxID=2997354 RepID=UPI0016033DD4|nr:DUF2285 domain-containing protein [Sphingomonas sp. So64.6b]QNA83759.1 DUF2285 domain-containing protein [Sphingomonas sp. So64.6b]
MIPAISPGTRAPARRRAGAHRQSLRWLAIQRNGGFTFAERPEVEAPDARIIWHADVDPGTMRVVANPIDRRHPDAIDPALLAPWLTIVRDGRCEHAVLSDGWHHIRIDVERGSLVAGKAVILHYQLSGVATVQPKLLPLRRLVDLCRTKRFALSLYPPDKRVDRWLLALRVHDAVQSGASQGEIATVLFGGDQEDGTVGRRSDSLRSRVRRLAVDARRLAGGGYRALMKRRDGSHTG